MSMFDKIAAEFAREIGLETSQPLESPFEVEVDGIPVVLSGSARRGEEEVILYTRLGKVCEANELDVYRVMLDANLLWSQTEDCTLGVNVETREAMICFRAPLEGRDGASLAALVAAFAENAKGWVNFVEASHGAGDGDPSDERTPDSSMIFRA